MRRLPLPLARTRDRALARPARSFDRPVPPIRRGGRVVECTALEMRRACKGTVGSNPTLSAIHFPNHSLN